MEGCKQAAGQRGILTLFDPFLIFAIMAKKVSVLKKNTNKFIWKNVLQTLAAGWYRAAVPMDVGNIMLLKDNGNNRFMVGFVLCNKDAEDSKKSQRICST